MAIADIPILIKNIAAYTTIFLFELITAYTLWFILKKFLKTTKFYRIAIMCCIISLVVGYIFSYRMIGYQITMDYLTEINNQKIEETGQGITLEEENAYKEKFIYNNEVQKFLITSSVKTSLIPFTLIAFIMILSVKRAKKKQVYERKN